MSISGSRFFSHPLLLLSVPPSSPTLTLGTRHEHVLVCTFSTYGVNAALNKWTMTFEKTGLSKRPSVIRLSP